MTTSRKGAWVAGLVIHGLLGALLIASGVGKLVAPPALDHKDTPQLVKTSGVGENFPLIGVGEAATGLLLLLPWTASLGVLLTSGFWGGAILFHLADRSPYAFQSGLLLLTWLGALLRMPEMFSSFLWRPEPPAKSA